MITVRMDIITTKDIDEIVIIFVKILAKQTIIMYNNLSQQQCC